MIERRSALALLGLLATLAGCSMTPVYERPAAPVPATYATGAAQPSAGVLPWKEYFTDPQLQALITLALENNRDLRVAALQVEQARAQWQIRQADQLPSVGLAANASRAPATGTGKLTNSFSAGLAITAWEIDFFGRLGALKEQGQAQFLASEEGRAAAQTTLVAAVANGWLALVADEELLELSRQTLATREESARLAQVRFEAGAASELDLRQAQSLAESARATLAQQLRQRALDENTLTLLLGAPMPDSVRAALPGSRLSRITPLADIPAGMPADLLTQRPDIRQAEQQLRAANANIGAARAAFFPRISLTAQAGTASGELSGLFKNGSWGFTIAPSLLQPIFDAGRNQANLEVSEAGKGIALAQYEKAIQTAFKEVSDALASQASLQQQAQAQQAQADAETRRLQLSSLRYENGVASYLDLLDAQRSLFALQQALVQARLALMQNKVLLYKAVGSGAA